MHATELAELSTFLAVARFKSFKQAAVERGVAASAVSHAIRSLEERVGVRLFHRTTRSVSLTEAGERFMTELRPAFGQIERALDSLNSFRGTPFGTVRINMPNSIAPYVLHDVMGPLVKQNPGLHLDIVATDRLIDIVDEGFDAGIRFGERLMQDMIAVHIKPTLRFSVVGTPEYFSGRSIPLKPADLRQHSCIRYRFPSGAIYNWQFEKDGEAIDIEVNGPVTIDSQELMVEAALQGCGLAYVWQERVTEHLKSGALIRCLDDWCAPDDNLFLYYPSRRYLSAGLRAVINMLKA
ncbi:LysR family transcriptional regulator [Agrobacterium sp. MOPV5]|uniref:LysR family transcriptional regulator n=1 Tax=Agrobacterium leguminum TaxID=2792015 RepID=UPI0018C26B32|nr:LysR family transcriptional regulator [Agrobacterium leguminum]MBG0511623.1 LysR family transcriptional regulator [Agrobacterium leguminum]